MLNTKIKIAICGTTARTVQCATALSTNPNFEISWVITPPPKPIGRKQILTANPLELWAKANQIAVKHVQKKLSELKDSLLDPTQTPEIDMLLVVDFGYLIPQWLLDLPKIAPINVHPSDLPKYRGSSPAQFALLYGEVESAVCIMRLIWELDAGPIIARLPLTLTSTTTQTEYYQGSFELASQALPQVLQQYADDRHETAQPVESPLPIAQRLDRQDGYFPARALSVEKIGLEFPSVSLDQDEKNSFSEVIQDLLSAQPDLTTTQLLDRMVRALSPWPGVWTTVEEYKGRTQVRLKILEGIYSASRDTYKITAWQYDGEQIQRIMEM